MPRSVNHVASRAKRKKILKLTRGYFGARRNVWTVAKNYLGERSHLRLCRPQEKETQLPRSVDSAYQCSRTSGRLVLQQAHGSDSQSWYRDQPQGARRPGYEQSRSVQGYRGEGEKRLMPPHALASKINTHKTGSRTINCGSLFYFFCIVHQRRITH